MSDLLSRISPFMEIIFKTPFIEWSISCLFLYFIQTSVCYLMMKFCFSICMMSKILKYFLGGFQDQCKILRIFPGAFRNSNVLFFLHSPSCHYYYIFYHFYYHPPEPEVISIFFCFLSPLGCPCSISS